MGLRPLEEFGMFGLGLSEIAVILLAIVVFVKPNELPKFMRKLGYVMRRMQDEREAFKRSLRALAREAAEDPVSAPGGEGMDSSGGGPEAGGGDP
jgi:Sec-independent protein translocase protein TatA